MPAGRVDHCTSYVPAGPLPTQARGIADLSFHIAANGAVSKARVVRSSGDVAYDNASIACANHTFMQPAMRGGRPIDIDWAGLIDWHAAPVAVHLSIPLKDEAVRGCAYPDLSRRLNEESAVHLAFEIGFDGAVENLVVDRTSGSERLDNAALGCVTRYRYAPPTRAGSPIRIDWHATVIFQLK